MGHSSDELYTKSRVSLLPIQRRFLFGMSASRSLQRRPPQTEPYDWSSISKMIPGLRVMWTLDAHNNLEVLVIRKILQIKFAQHRWLSAIWGGGTKSLTVYCISFEMYGHMFLTSSMHPNVGFDLSLKMTRMREICQTLIDQKTIMPLASTGRRANRNRGVGWVMQPY